MTCRKPEKRHVMSTKLRTTMGTRAHRVDDPVEHTGSVIVPSFGTHQVSPARKELT